ncbi:MAG: universal stress protein [Bacteroidetes bacterium]|nr:universal stress protein [Bacteroidota bacterium]
MKKILVPIDFSEISENALNYAAGLAKFVNGKLILLHIYHVRVPASETPLLVLSLDDLEKENMLLLKKLSEKINRQEAVETELIVRPGFVVEGIISIVSEKKIDLVVMGITGAGKPPGVLIGSNTTSFIKKATVPVLVIPKNVSFGRIRKIVFAYDYKKVVAPTLLVKLKEFAALFNSEILVVDIVKPAEVPDFNQAVAGMMLEHSLVDVRHTLYFPSDEDDNLVQQIDSFVESHDADLLVMLPDSHKSLRELFHRSNTKRMAFHTRVPLLTLHY